MYKFKKIYVEITNICNMSCSFCPKIDRELEYISVDNFKKIIEKIKGHTKSVYLHIKGEPLMHPQFEELVEIASANDFVVNVTTNGTLIAKKEKFILESQKIRQLNISLHSHSAEEPENDFEKYISDIVAFLKKSEEFKLPYASLRLWNIDEKSTNDNVKNENRKILEPLEELFKLDEKLDHMKVVGKGIKLRDNVFMNFQSLFQWPDIESEYRETEGICRGLSEHIGILVDGSVVPCCLDSNGDAVLGNIFESSIDDIMNGKEANNIRDGFAEGRAVNELCIKCSYKERFGKK